MPKIYEICGYQISIWSSENGEPIHVHVSKRRPTPNSTKLWLLSNGTFEIAHNRSKVPDKDLNKIINILNCNSKSVYDFWVAYHGYAKFYK